MAPSPEPKSTYRSDRPTFQGVAAQPILTVHNLLVRLRKKDVDAREGTCAVDGTMLLIGDVHGRFRAYKRIIKSAPASIQVGDMGVGFARVGHGVERSHGPRDV
jgi:hypothetical protein